MNRMFGRGEGGDIKTSAADYKVEEDLKRFDPWDFLPWP